MNSRIQQNTGDLLSRTAINSFSRESLFCRVKCRHTHRLFVIYVSTCLARPTFAPQAYRRWRLVRPFRPPAASCRWGWRPRYVFLILRIEMTTQRKANRKQLKPLIKIRHISDNNKLYLFHTPRHENASGCVVPAGH
jgi:hypothetical protein